MKPKSPVIPGGKTVFGESIFREGQPEYILRTEDEYGTIITRWELTWRERMEVLFGGSLWVSAMTFRRALQPIKIETSAPAVEVVNATAR